MGNQIAKPVSGDIELTLKGGRTRRLPFGQIEMGKQAMIHVPFSPTELAELPSPLAQFSLNVNTEAGATAEQLTTPIAKAYKTRGPVTIDGKLIEWSAARAILLDARHVLDKGKEYWTGPNDASANVRLMWDNDNLYIGAVVRDDRIVQPYTGSEAIQHGDGLHLFIDANQLEDFLSEYNNGDDFRINLGAPSATHPNGEVQYGAQSGDTITNESIKLFVVRASDSGGGSGGGYVLEAAIPWDNFSIRSTRMPGVRPQRFSPKAGKSLGFELGLVDDDTKDTAGRDSDLMWAAGLTHRSSRAGVDPSLLGTLILVE